MDYFLSLLIAAANLVLHQTVERIHVGKKYGDIPRGIFVVRGENVVLLGEIVSKRLSLPALCLLPARGSGSAAVQGWAGGVCGDMTSRSTAEADTGSGCPSVCLL